ncbi:acyl--CoA ligase [Saccharothrix sp. AJ9571]|nr:acyl--CoA ligase [Saccharothrix sp. AJ9571]
MTEWVSNTGLRLRDLVPAECRADWVRRGLCPDRDLFSLFADHAAARPDRPAVIDSRGVLDYAELLRLVERAAAGLHRAGFGRRDVVGIHLPNGRDAVAVELAVYALGAVALPIPRSSGVRDLRALLGRAQARGLITAVPYASGSWPRPYLDPEHPARFLVSSGSEAEPKMVAYSHNAFAGGRANYVRALGSGPMRNLVLVPLASSFGSCGVPVGIAALGSTLIVQDSFDAAGAVRAMTAHRPTHVFAVPTMLSRMTAVPTGSFEDLSELDALVASGAALPGSVRRACETRFGRRVVAVYGSSDGVNCRDGVPDPAVAGIRVVGGEIQARGPMSPLCYVGAPELDARYRTADGWVRTGDLGRIDARGRLHVLGRQRQVVIRGGYNISPAEVESELGAHPAVAEVACVGVPDSDLGERLCACVVPREGGLTLSALTGFLEARGLERRKLPESLVLLPELPHGPTGKICRTSLRTLVSAHGH